MNQKPERHLNETLRIGVSKLSQELMQHQSK